MLNFLQIMNIYPRKQKNIKRPYDRKHCRFIYRQYPFLLTKQPKILQHLVFQEILNIMEIPLKEIAYEHYTKILNEIAKRKRDDTSNYLENFTYGTNMGCFILKDILPPTLHTIII